MRYLKTKSACLVPEIVTTLSTSPSTSSSTQTPTPTPTPTAEAPNPTSNDGNYGLSFWYFSDFGIQNIIYSI